MSKHPQPQSLRLTPQFFSGLNLARDENRAVAWFLRHAFYILDHTETFKMVYGYLSVIFPLSFAVFLCLPLALFLYWFEFLFVCVFLSRPYAHSSLPA